MSSSSDDEEESSSTSLNDCEVDSAWQQLGGLTASVLREVFSWLGGAELARAGAACRAWRAAAAAPPLWRRLLLQDVPPDQRAHLAHLYETRGWREEWVCAHAGWELRARLPARRTMAHAALAPCASRLALATDDAEVLIWERVDSSGEAWREVDAHSVRARGWSGVARAEWAPRAPATRLLLAGPLAVANRWELIILQEQEDSSGSPWWSVAARAGCSGGAAGCWAGAGAFLALEVRRYAPYRCATTVWLNAATQETHSEYTGVATPLLRVYHEGGAAVT